MPSIPLWRRSAFLDCVAKGVLLLDVRETMSNRSDYFDDFIHLTDEGNETLAKELAAFLKALGLLNE